MLTVPTSALCDGRTPHEPTREGLITVVPLTTDHVCTDYRLKDSDGDIVVRARALLPPRYDRRLFGMLLDAWQEDLVLLRHAPPPEPDDDDESEQEPGEQARTVVN